MKYKVIEAENVEKLNANINGMMEGGWEPIGGVSVSLSETDDHQYFVCAQAMLLKREA